MKLKPEQLAEIRHLHYKFIVTHRMSHGEVDAHKHRKQLLDHITALEATIKAAGELADEWENDETLGRERDGIICADQLRKLLRSKDNG